MANDKKQKQDTTASTSTLRNRRGLWVMLGILVISLSMMSTFVIYALHTGKFDVHDIGEASYTCEEAIARKFGKRIVVMHYDGLSSHYKPDTGDYIVFYRVDARMDDKNPLEISDYLVKCVVRETFGFVLGFDAFKLGSHYSG
ncbi:MAG TPA: hypothetical protein VL027_08095 [Spongiibacteraceae bacterium]|jgi:hypothetical protein|nr:hypothetical protein [Spongiibacteraceae bacterium]HUH37889.1 hypothetical protein [Spongiibacteraceae bacterium]